MAGTPELSPAHKRPHDWPHTHLEILQSTETASGSVLDSIESVLDVATMCPKSRKQLVLDLVTDYQTPAWRPYAFILGSIDSVCIAISSMKCLIINSYSPNGHREETP